MWRQIDKRARSAAFKECVPVGWRTAVPVGDCVNVAFQDGGCGWIHLAKAKTFNLSFITDLLT